MGPKIPERGSKTSTVPIVWAIFGILSARSKWFLVTIGDHGETCLYHSDPEIKQQSMDWRRSDSLRPKKIPSEKITWKSTRLNFLESRRNLHYWLSLKGPTSQRGVLLISAGEIEGHFEEKTPRDFHLVGLDLARKCLGSPGTCNPEETGLPGVPVSWTPTLFSGSGPIGLPPVSWTEKTIEISQFFVRRRGHCCCWDLVGRTNLWISFYWLAKIRATD